MRHVAFLLALGVCPAQTAPLTREMTDPRSDVRHRDFTVDSRGPVISLAYSDDPNTLASEGAKHSVALWDVENGWPVRKAGAGQPPRHGAIAAFSADGAEAASVTGIAIEAWKYRIGRPLTTLLGHTGKIRAPGDDGVSYLWAMPLPRLSAEDLREIEAALPSKPTAAPTRPFRVLVFRRADAIQHKEGVPAANKGIELLARPTAAVQADFSRAYDVPDPKILSRYDAIIMNSTAHLAIPDEGKKAALLEYVRKGGGVTGDSRRHKYALHWLVGAEVKERRSRDTCSCQPIVA
jgi:hypothetical protein